MLTTLQISNFLLIKNQEVRFEKGFSVITGETGAGKSVLLDSLMFVLGGKSSSKLLSKGAERGFVVACFDIYSESLRNFLEENSISNENNQLIIRRVLYKDGKTKNYINDIQVGAALIKKIADDYLVEIHAQNIQHELLNASNHLSFLDLFGELGRDIINVTEKYRLLQNARSEYSDLKKQIDNISRERGYLEYVLNELKDLNPEIGEEAKLTELKIKYQSSEKVTKLLGSVLDDIEGEDGFGKKIASINKQLIRSNIGLDFTYVMNELEKAFEAVESAKEYLISLQNQYQNNDVDIDQLESRLFAIKNAAKKYGKTSDELADYINEVTEKMANIENSDNLLDNIIKQIELHEKQYLEAAFLLSEKRKQIAKSLEILVNKELSPLKLEHAKFRVMVQEFEIHKATSKGINSVAFEVKTNPGSNFEQIGKIASGGEISRFTMALRSVLAKVRPVSTIVFDEIDTGIGGAVAHAVGQRMLKLAEFFQVIAVTHQPIIAALASNHYLIEKYNYQDDAETKITKLEPKTRKDEIARMISGATVTEEAIAAATKLINA